MPVSVEYVSSQGKVEKQEHNDYCIDLDHLLTEEFFVKAQKFLAEGDSSASAWVARTAPQRRRGNRIYMFYWPECGKGPNPRPDLMHLEGAVVVVKEEVSKS